MNINDFFDKFTSTDTFSRVDKDHILELYLGINENGQRTLLFICDDEPNYISPSHMLIIQKSRRQDGRWALSFILSDNALSDVFSHFCSDIIESSRHLTAKNQGAQFICNRYEQWQRLLQRSQSGLLSTKEIEGLCGELYYLKEYLIPKYGKRAAINAWRGPFGEKQDFRFENEWYEIKTTNRNADSVSISSIEQLDSDIPGHLIIILLDNANRESTDFSLNSIVAELISYLADQTLESQLLSILLEFGYYKTEAYDNPRFRFSHANQYTVTSDFPCLRRNKIPEAVLKASYFLSFRHIKPYKIEA